ncbi:hypothetical protein QBC36DRAFT_382776 [Triangularia setosa]|uniref:Uncharacterized protein n=1 Tax=Triangularia setosa TaxID=2587417 RepID=A0AAN6VWU8_9PEZI|nr:hypothetical protein QBC36DRAFT_382776 [Podospora setosa]
MSSRHSSSPARSTVSSCHSTPTRPSSREGQRFTLGRIRVALQDQPNPLTVVPLANTSRTFRFAVYCITFALNLLESQKGRSGLINTGKEVWRTWQRARRGLRFQGDIHSHPELMDQAVDQYLANLRSDPPNIIVSNRVVGEGKTERMNWNDYLDGEYSSKFGVIFRLNKTIIDNAIFAGDNQHREDFERFLLLMGLATAHELVHTFVGFLTGNEDTNTPPRVQFPVPSTLMPNPLTGAEAGAFWEGQMLGFLVQAWENSRSRLGDRQAGDMLGLGPASRHYALGERWMRSWILLDFSAQPERSSAPISVSGRKVMQKTDRRKALLDENDLPRALDKTPFIERLNSFSSHLLPVSVVRDVMSMAAHPSRIRA